MFITCSDLCFWAGPNDVIPIFWFWRETRSGFTWFLPNRTLLLSFFRPRCCFVSPTRLFPFFGRQCPRTKVRVQLQWVWRTLVWRLEFLHIDLKEERHVLGSEGPQQFYGTEEYINVINLAHYIMHWKTNSLSWVYLRFLSPCYFAIRTPPQPSIVKSHLVRYLKTHSQTNAASVVIHWQGSPCQGLDLPS